MSWAGLGLHTLALLVYPGLGLTLVFGLLAEGVYALAVDRAGLAGAALVPLTRLRDSATTAWPLVFTTAMLSGLAATQLALPFTPLSPLERNLLVAVIAVAAAIWLGWGWAWSGPGAGATLVFQGCWLVAVVSPAIVSETLRPQALGAVAVPTQMPLKVLSGLLYIVCIPALLQIAGGERPVEVAATRTWLWLPLCGLGVSLFLPPAADDIGGLLRYVAAALVLALIAIGLGAALRLPPAGGRVLHRRLASALAAVVLIVAALTSAFT